VAIPPEWQAAPVKPAQAPAQDIVSGPPAALGSGEGILKSAPSFREGNLPAGQGSPVSPPSMKKQEPQAPQQLASMHLVDQAKTALSQGKPDAAIPLLEQAIQIDVYNGEAFFGLARAWKMKGSRNKAQEFAQKAEVLLQDQPSKLKEVYSFQADLFKELGDTRKMESYRQKASNL
jgi:tetratricopeptide (TPR) repeat protein